MVSGIRLYVHRRDTKGPDLVGFDSRPVHVMGIMRFIIVVLAVVMVYLLIFH